LAAAGAEATEVAAAIANKALELREGAWRVTIGSFGQAGGRADDVIALLRADPDGRYRESDSRLRHSGMVR
jgi:hypothetical protein